MSEKKQLILLSRRPVLFKAVASWGIEEIEVYLHDSPSEALAQAAMGNVSIFVFDTENYARYRHVVRKFLSLNCDAELIVIGADDLADLATGESGRLDPGSLRRLAPDAPEPELRLAIERVLRLRDVRARSGIVGRSRAVAEMISLIAHVAPLDVNVLIMGESGTGKELVARAIHEHSKRASGPFVGLNCGAMSEGVLESELFGHVRGAFTGAVSAHDGVFKQAEGGTFFMDEVAELPLGMQTRFLRTLETGEYTPVGGRGTLKSDIRLVAATNRDLGEEVVEGRFRQDLYYRLRVVVIPTPPLRERIEDVHLLAEHFLRQENQTHGLAVRGFSRPARERLEMHSWPGNVRELRNLVRSAVVIKQTGLVEVEDLPPEFHDVIRGQQIAHPPVPLSATRDGLERDLLATTLFELRRDVRDIKAMLQGGAGAISTGRIPVSSESVVETYAGEVGYSPFPGASSGDLETAERALIENALRSTGGNRRQAAHRLGISERTLYRKIKLYGLSK